MPVQLLTPPAVFAVYGKLPGAGDFLRLNCGPAAAVLETWLETGLADAKSRDDAFAERFARAGPWRMALDAGAAGSRTLAGVMAPSRDACGRTFPCLVFTAAEARLEPGRIAAASGWFDAVEARLLTAVAGAAPAPSLLRGLEALGPLPEHAPQDLLVNARSISGGTLIDVEGGPSPDADALQAALEVAPPRSGSSLWWRREGDRTRVMIADGLPGGDAFRNLFRAARAAAPPPAKAVAG